MNKAFYSSLALIVVVSLSGMGSASAQSSGISPYSRYGIGDLQDQSSVLNFSMGGTGIAYHNDGLTPFFINLKNPASYAYNFIPIEDSAGKGGLKMAAFEAGIVDNILNLSTQGQTIKNNDAYLAYVALNVPISRHVGLALGLSPVSTEGYNITTTNTIDSNNIPNHPIATVQNQYQGSGGINKVFVGLAYSPFKNFSIGGNFSYLFGSLTNEEDIYFPAASIGNLPIAAYNTLKIENTSIHSFFADFGLMYTVKLWSDWNVTLGATVTPSLPINASYSIYSGPQYYNGFGNIAMDTLQDSSSVGKIKMPLIIGGGITIKKGEQWTFSFDYTWQNWSQYSYFGQSENLANSYKYGAGIQFVPKKLYSKNYFQRIHYRLGFSYGLNYLDLYNTQLKDMSLSAGLGLPIGPSNPYNHPSVLNLGIQVGSFGTTTNNLIQQNYVKLMVGFTFDDHWFEKRKFQ